MSNQRDVGIGVARGLERRSVIAALACAGIAGPLIFAVAALMQSLLREDHSLVSLPISALAAGPSASANTRGNWRRSLRNTTHTKPTSCARWRESELLRRFLSC